jgi:hypothetical protein
VADPIPLTDPSGTVRSYICGTCLRIGSGAEFMGGERLTDEQIEHARKDCRDEATRCCSCRECGTPTTRRVDWSILCERCEPVVREREREAELKHATRDERLRAAQAEALKLSTDPIAAQALALEISGLSEKYYCASWLIDCEYTLWSFVQGAPRDWGFGEVTEEECAFLKGMSERAGGWIVWDDEVGGELFVPADEWTRRYAERTTDNV